MKMTVRKQMAVIMMTPSCCQVGKTFVGSGTREAVWGSLDAIEPARRPLAALVRGCHDGTGRRVIVSPGVVSSIVVGPLGERAGYHFGQDHASQDYVDAACDVVQHGASFS